MVTITGLRIDIFGKKHLLSSYSADLDLGTFGQKVDSLGDELSLLGCRRPLPGQAVVQSCLDLAFHCLAVICQPDVLFPILDDDVLTLDDYGVLHGFLSRCAIRGDAEADLEL